MIACLGVGVNWKLLDRGGGVLYNLREWRMCCIMGRAGVAIEYLACLVSRMCVISA
jgi:hypothetical protein